MTRKAAAVSGLRRKVHAAGSERGTSSLPLNLVDPEDHVHKKDVVQNVRQPHRRIIIYRTLSFWSKDMPFMAEN